MKHYKSYLHNYSKGFETAIFNIIGDMCGSVGTRGLFWTPSVRLRFHVTKRRFLGRIYVEALEQDNKTLWFRKWLTPGMWVMHEDKRILRALCNLYEAKRHLKKVRIPSEPIEEQVGVVLRDMNVDYVIELDLHQKYRI